MFEAKDIIEKYIAFFEKQGHKRISNSPLVPQNDPTTLFTSSGMQPLVPYLLGEPHPQGKRLVNIQNCFRAQDIDEIGNNRHTTFFRMLGNWSLGGYFKKLQLPWFFEFLTKKLNIDPERLYASIFNGFEAIPKDVESEKIWRETFEKAGVDPKNRIFFYGADKNWWSRTGGPKEMPEGEPGGPDSEVFYDFGKELGLHENSSFKNDRCNPNCQCGRFMEIGNSVFMQYQKRADGSFKELPQRNVDFGGGLERILAVIENEQDIHETSLFLPIIQTIEQKTEKQYADHAKNMRIIVDHFVASVFIASSNVTPSNKEQGYILRRLLRRGLDNLYAIGGKDVAPILESVVEQYKETDPNLVSSYEKVKYTILEEEKRYLKTLHEATSFINKKYPSASSGQVKQGDELKGITEISAQDAFVLYSTHGLSPSQIKNLGYEFSQQEYAEIMKQHKQVSKKGAEKKFAGGLADTQERTIMGHTATHLLHQALRDVLGDKVHQTGSNITTERIRFDFNYDKKLTDEEIQRVENIVNGKIKENLPVHFEMLPIEEAKKIGAIGLFNDIYQDKSKIYFIGPSAGSEQVPYSIEFCGGPHIDFTGKLKSFKIIKQENIGQQQKRLYAVIENSI